VLLSQLPQDCEDQAAASKFESKCIENAGIETRLHTV
jgi:hypothetical protein